LNLRLHSAKRATSTVLTRFRSAVLLRPNSTAVLFDGRSISYGELDDASDGLAEQLRQAELRPGNIVGIFANRGPDLVVAMLAALKRGATFVVYDAAFPDERIRTLVRISRPDRIIMATVDEVDRIRGERIAGERALSPPDGGWLAAGCVHSTPEKPLEEAPAPSLTDIAYLLFTSGTTGTPKCIACGHGPLDHLIEWQIRRFKLDASDRFSALSGIAHDPFLRDVFTPLSLGAAVILPRQAEILDPPALGSWWHATRPTVSHLTPQMGTLLASSIGQSGTGVLRLAFWGGDKLHASVIQRLHAIEPQVQQINFYGATETPQAAAYFSIDPTIELDGILPVGAGIEDFSIHVLDDAGVPAAPGEVGQLAVESDFLSLGYLVDGVVHPFESSGRLYLTGDLGRQDEAGIVTVIGRRDDQIKIRGYRVELGEIASAIRQVAGVKEAICIATGETESLKIAAFAILDNTCAEKTSEIMRFLEDQFPKYMIPSRLLLLESIPLLPNNKVDRQKLVTLLAADAAETAVFTDHFDVAPPEAELIEA
jgi:amino acid adenylation domain-containing protein